MVAMNSTEETGVNMNGIPNSVRVNAKDCASNWSKSNVNANVAEFWVCIVKIHRATSMVSVFLQLYTLHDGFDNDTEK